MPLQLYRNLVGGHWALEKSSYLFYSESTLAILGPSEELARLKQTEKRKLALGRAVERFLDEPRAFLAEQEYTCLALWRSEPFAAILLAEPFLRSHVWPAAFNGPRGSGSAVFLAHSRRPAPVRHTATQPRTAQPRTVRHADHSKRGPAFAAANLAPATPTPSMPMSIAAATSTSA